MQILRKGHVCEMTKVSNTNYELYIDGDFCDESSTSMIETILGIKEYFNIYLDAAIQRYESKHDFQELLKQLGW